MAAVADAPPDVWGGGGANNAPMRYRICKAFTVESGHMLSKHKGLCRHPHGHSRRVEVVLSCRDLDDNDMVCDFKAVKLAVEGFLSRFDHALAINSEDPMLPGLQAASDRLVVFEGQDPTTEAMAHRIFDHLAAEIRLGRVYTDDAGQEYRLSPGVTLERVRVGETPSSWAEYGLD